MMKEVSRSAALLNAQAVMASAAMFGRGEAVTLSVYATVIILTCTYDTASHVYDREIAWLMDRCMCGVRHWKKEHCQSHTFTISVSWSFNPNLK